MTAAYETIASLKSQLAALRLLTRNLQAQLHIAQRHEGEPETCAHCAEVWAVTEPGL